MELEGLETGLAHFMYPHNYTGNSAIKLQDKEYRHYWGMTTALIIVTGVDIYLTKGKLSAFVMGTQAASMFEHNRAKTPEGKQEQRARENEALLNVAIGWGIGKVFGAAGEFLNNKLGTVVKSESEEIKYLFRGTSEGFPGNRSLQITGSSPTSTDPAVATILAINSKSYGNGVVHIVLPQELQGITYGVSNNVLDKLELEIVVGLKPLDLAKKATMTIPVDESVKILKGLGIELPKRISNGEVSPTIENTRKLTTEEINKYYNEAIKLKSDK